MNPKIEKMFNDAEGRYLEPTEQSMLIEYASSLEARLAAMRAIEEHESAIVTACVERMLDDQPELTAKHLEVKEKSIRDMTLVLRACSAAMVRDSEQLLSNRLVPWFRTVINAFEMHEAIEQAYSTLISEIEAKLEPEHFELIAPFLKLTHEGLAE